MATDKKIICPLLGGKCVEDGSVVDGELVACRFWVYVHGRNPQDGSEVKNGDCAIAWMPVLLIENSKVNRETGAAVEGLRNENISAATMLANTMLHVSRQQAILPATEMKTIEECNPSIKERGE